MTNSYVVIAFFKEQQELSVYGPFNDQEAANDFADRFHDRNKGNDKFEWSTVAQVMDPRWKTYAQRKKKEPSVEV